MSRCVYCEGGTNALVCACVQEDDLGKGDSSEIGTQGKTSETTGNAGGRLACGVIGMGADEAAM